MSRYQSARYQDRDRPSPPSVVSNARRELARLFNDSSTDNHDSTDRDTNTLADDFTKSAASVFTEPKRIALPIANARVQIQNSIACLTLDNLAGKPTILLLDENFWKRTLSQISGGRLFIEQGKVFVAYPSRLGLPRVEHWLANLVTGRREDYLSVRAEDGLTIIDYRKAALEVRHTLEQDANAKRLEKRAKLDSDKPDRPLYFGHEKLLQPFDDVLTDFTNDPTPPTPIKPDGIGSNDAAGGVTKLAYTRGDAGRSAEQPIPVYLNDGGVGGI